MSAFNPSIQFRMLRDDRALATGQLALLTVGVLRTNRTHNETGRVRPSQGT